MTLPNKDTQVPGWIIGAIILVNMFLLIPPVLVAKARFSTSRATRIHVFYDMDQQQKYTAQSSNDLFRDGRSSRLPVPGTVARGQLNQDSHYYWGTVDGDWANSFPPEVDVNAALLARGEARYGIYCTPCHGISGHGDGMIARRTAVSDYGAWTVTDLSSEKGLAHPIGELFNIIGHGINTMPGYKSQIPIEDRWAIVAHVKAIQFSQSVDVAEIPAGEKQRLESIEKAPGSDDSQPSEEGGGSQPRQGR